MCVGFCCFERWCILLVASLCVWDLYRLCNQRYISLGYHAVLDHNVNQFLQRLSVLFVEEVEFSGKRNEMCKQRVKVRFFVEGQDFIIVMVINMSKQSEQLSKYLSHDGWKLSWEFSSSFGWKYSLVVQHVLYTRCHVVNVLRCWQLDLFGLCI